MKFEIIHGDPKTIHRDKRVPLKVRGLFTTILCLPSHWNFTIAALTNLVPDDEESVKACLKYLIRLGYAKRIRIISKETHLVKQHLYRFFESGTTAIEPGPVANQMLPGFARPPKKRKVEHKDGPIPNNIITSMYELCYANGSGLGLTSSQRGRVASVLGQLREVGADFNDIAYFEQWWADDWRSTNRETRQKQPPRPEQVLEFWWVAVKYKKKPPVPESKPVPQHMFHLHDRMAHIAEQRRQGSK